MTRRGAAKRPCCCCWLGRARPVALARLARVARSLSGSPGSPGLSRPVVLVCRALAMSCFSMSPSLSVFWWRPWRGGRRVGR